MWPSLSGMTPVKVSSSVAKLQSEKISSVVPLRILERQHFTNARRDVVAPLALDPRLAQSLGDCGEIACGGDLKRQARRFAGVAALERDRFEPGFGGQDGAVLVTRDQAQSDN